jgi:tyrosyl-tRNA synthetase
VDETDAIEAGLADGSAHPNEVKRRLAREIVGLYHGPEAAVTAEAAFDRVFKQHEAPEDVPEVRVTRADPVHLPALMQNLGLAESRGEGRRLIDQGGVRIDGEPVAAGTYDLPWDAVAGRVVQAGKRRFARPVG